MALEEAGVCRLVATCDPNPELAKTQGVRFRFAERGVEVYSSVQEMLAVHGKELGLITLPIPIPLHAEQHRLAIDAGVPCYLEKPPSLWWPEFQAMLEVDLRANKATQVGFNFVGDPFRRALKERILSGEFGRLEEVRLHAIWPRNAAYYARNNWGGRLRVGDRWVLDSPIGNAMAHYVQNLLFWCGMDGVDSVGQVSSVRAWLGRTRPIESYDTVCLEADLASGPLLRIGATHAEIGPTCDRETLIFEKARIVLPKWNEVHIDSHDGRREEHRSEIKDHAAMLRHNLTRYLSFVTGVVDRPTTTLADSLSFVALCDLALISAGVIEDVDTPPDLGRFVEGGQWPRPEPTSAPVGDLSRLEEVALNLAHSSPSVT